MACVCLKVICVTRSAMIFSLVKQLRRIPGLQRYSWKMRTAYHRTMRRSMLRKPIVSADQLLFEAIIQRRPFAAGKMGSVECRAAVTFVVRESNRKSGAKLKPYGQYHAKSLFMNAGVFPEDAGTFDAFYRNYLEAVSCFDALVAWDIAGEVQILKKYASTADLISIKTLDPFYSGTPWTKALTGKRVLVISPFVASIARQYQKRESIWDNPDMLPEFELLTLRAPLSAGLGHAEDKDWFGALERLKGGMDILDYDVALIGAGAFSLPLAAHAKASGSIGIHLGGSTQMLFGVYGNRWLKSDFFRPLINDEWVRPDPAETPGTVNAIEGACYW